MRTDSVLAVVHQIAKGLFQTGVIEVKTMREFERLCRPVIKEYTPIQIKRLRLKNQVSQAVFAA